jgi:hypothetical protein
LTEDFLVIITTTDPDTDIEPSTTTITITDEDSKLLTTLFSSHGKIAGKKESSKSHYNNITFGFAVCFFLSSFQVSRERLSYKQVNNT